MDDNNFFYRKKVKTTTQKYNLYFTIVDYISKNNKLPLLDISKQNLNYYLKNLKKAGIINKVGYGTWEVIKEFSPDLIKRSKKIATSNINQHTINQEVRGHAFMFHLKLPKISNWEKRRDYLKRKNIKYTKLNNLGLGEKIEIDNKKIHLKNRCIIIYEKESYIAEKAAETRSLAIYEFYRIVKKLENLLNISFLIRKQYVFKVCREHYALVKNCLAKQYDKENKRLKVYCSKGLWFVIDNSFNLHEAETLLLGEAVQDNEGVQNYFNSHKETGFKVTPEFILERINDLVQDRQYYAENLKSHVKAIQQLGEAVESLQGEIKKLSK